ncbi:hypothetical protein MLD38_015836 [Melastoma candidum]|uniref:Uncharacterized protein n=1 Tax=Melastoma candidum TaxID=119954 RepID=A0ACB9RH86_9MYRT|nr:hypothetical protein MLD38_015836 [Melastoma candidum]
MVVRATPSTGFAVRATPSTGFAVRATTSLDSVGRRATPSLDSVGRRATPSLDSVGRRVTPSAGLVVRMLTPSFDLVVRVTTSVDSIVRVTPSAARVGGDKGGRADTARPCGDHGCGAYPFSIVVVVTASSPVLPSFLVVIATKEQNHGHHEYRCHDRGRS